MALELKSQEVRKVNYYEPVEIENGITLKMSRFIEGKNIQLTCTAITKGEDGNETELGKADLSTASNHLFVQVFPVSALGAEKTLDLAGTLLEALTTMFKED
jgi:hypothetical protein